MAVNAREEGWGRCERELGLERVEWIDEKKCGMGLVIGRLSRLGLDER